MPVLPYRQFPAPWWLNSSQQCFRGRSQLRLLIRTYFAYLIAFNLKSKGHVSCGASHHKTPELGGFSSSLPSSRVLWRGFSCHWPAARGSRRASHAAGSIAQAAVPRRMLSSIEEVVVGGNSGAADGASGPSAGAFGVAAKDSGRLTGNGTNP